MKMGCWAADLGDCDGKLSGEHIVSAGLWSGPWLTVEGGPWGTPRELGLANLTAKILCRRHNSRLSEADTAGADAFAAITASIALTNARKSIPAQPWMRHGFSVDGPGLERWFLKTAINVAIFLKREPPWAHDPKHGLPPRDVVEMAFGIRPVPRPFGLYTVAAVGDPIVSKEEVRCHMLYAKGKRVAGATFVFRGFEFMLNLTSAPVEGILSQIENSIVIRPKDQLHYHLSRINSDVNGYRSHFLDFNWPEVDFNHLAL